MMRFIVVLFLLLIGASVGLWLSAKALPSWYEDGVSTQDQTKSAIAKKLESQGVRGFLGSKLGEILNGQLLLDEAEFNALILYSLKRSRDGRQLLDVTDAIHADLRDSGIELGLIIDLRKLAKQDARIKKSVDRVLEVIPFSQSEKIALSITGVPVARQGNIGFSENFTLSLGAIPVSSDLLRTFGVNTDKLAQESLRIRSLRINSIDTLNNQILLGVTPRF